MALDEGCGNERSSATKAKFGTQGTCLKGRDAIVKAYAGFDKVRNELEAKVLELQDANTNVKNATKQFQNTIDKEDFGLNEKDKDDAKKIQQAAIVIDDFL